MAGCTAFLISNKNSSAAVAHLLKKTGTRNLFVSNDDQMQKLASASLESLAADGHGIDVFQPPVFQDFYPDNAQDEVLQELPYFHQDSPAIIMHSSGAYYKFTNRLGINALECSGSTSFPKPIPHSHKKLVEVGRSRCTPSSLYVLLVLHVSHRFDW